MSLCGLRTAHAQWFFVDNSSFNGRRMTFKVSYERELNFLSISDIILIISICFKDLFHIINFFPKNSFFFFI